MRGRQESLEHEAAALRAERVELQKNAIRLEAASRTAEIQYRELLARFQREVPSGEIRELSQLVADRLDQGVPADRIAFFINAADRVRACGNPETKRFIVPTPIYTGTHKSAGLAEGRNTDIGNASWRARG